MKIITVTVRVRNAVYDGQNSRTAFWNDFALNARLRTAGSLDSDEFASRQEQTLRNLLPLNLLSLMVRDLLGKSRDFDDLPLKRPEGESVSPARLVTTVEAIRYGSMKVDLGLPDVDAFVELIGNNSEAFEAIFGAYLPEAFNNVFPSESGSLNYSVEIPRDVRDYIDSRPAPAAAPKADEASAKDKGAALVSSALRSPLIFPALLACFLWYYARQDMMQERQITSGLIQTLVTEQTAVLSILKDKQDAEVKDHSPEHPTGESPKSTTPKPKTD